MTWESATEAYGSGMGGVYQGPEGQWLVWRFLLYKATQSRLVTDNNLTGDVTINDLELDTLLAQVLLFEPKRENLLNIRTAMDNTMA